MHWLGPAHGRPLLLHARMPNIADVLKAEVAQMAHGTAFADRSTQCGSSGAPGGHGCAQTASARAKAGPAKSTRIIQTQELRG